MPMPFPYDDDGSADEGELMQRNDPLLEKKDPEEDEKVAIGSTELAIEPEEDGVLVPVTVG